MLYVYNQTIRSWCHSPVLLETCFSLVRCSPSPSILQLTSGIFASFIPGVKPKDVYIAATVDQGLNVVNACKALGLEALLCLCHRINSLVLWAVGISGSASTCKKPDGRVLVGSGTLTVGVWSHCGYNNDAFRDVQEQLIIEDQEEFELVDKRLVFCIVPCLSLIHI